MKPEPRPALVSIWTTPGDTALLTAAAGSRAWSSGGGLVLGCVLPPVVEVAPLDVVVVEPDEAGCVPARVVVDVVAAACWTLPSSPLLTRPMPNPTAAVSTAMAAIAPMRLERRLLPPCDGGPGGLVPLP